MEKKLTRTEMLVNRFFEIIDDEYSINNEIYEMFLIRDLLINDYIEGRERQSTVGMIEEIIEEDIMPQIEKNLEGMREYDKDTGDKTVALAYFFMSIKDVDSAIEMINLYSEWGYKHPYVYYCMVRELERLTGETYIELCLCV